MSVVVAFRSTAPTQTGVREFARTNRIAAAYTVSTLLSHAHADSDFFYLAEHVDDVRALYERFCELETFVRVVMRCDYASHAVYAERQRIDNLPMSEIVSLALNSNDADWTHRPAYYGALVGVFYERMHYVRLACGM
jgi:hypothetical protein